MSDTRPFITDTDMAAMRAAMVVSQLRPNGVTDSRLLAVMGSVPREAFVAEGRGEAAYTDRPVPLSPARSLNPPMTTARLIDALELRPTDRLLVVGAATGYATVVASALCASAVGVEEDEALLAAAPEAAKGATLVAGRLSVGAPDHAPFDAILIDGAVEGVPDAIVAQLARDGRLSCGVVKDGVTRLALGRRGGGSFALADFADAEVVLLPGFAHTREFVF